MLGLTGRRMGTTACCTPGSRLNGRLKKIKNAETVQLIDSASSILKEQERSPVIFVPGTARSRREQLTLSPDGSKPPKPQPDFPLIHDVKEHAY